MYVYWQIILISTKHVVTNSNSQYVCGEGPSKNVTWKCIESTCCVKLNQLAVLNKTGIQPIQ
jgi:hypothetical protein